MLWISATNPAVSLPQLSRIRQILDKEDLFVIVLTIMIGVIIVAIAGEFLRRFRLGKLHR